MTIASGRAPRRTRRSRTTHRTRSALATAIAFALAVSLLTGCGGSDGVLEFTAADSGTEIDLDTGDEFTLRLESNPTTGYAWEVDDTTFPSGLELVSSTYVADDTSGEVVGSGGTDVLVFAARASAAGVLRLSYLRSFETEAAPARVVEYLVRIDGAAWSPTASPTTATPTTATLSTPTTDPAAFDSAVWPWPSATRGPAAQRFDDPVTAATSFAVDFVGFTDPIVGEFLQGDSRSGEVEIRNRVNGPATTVFVRQLGTDDTWWVLGAATGDIVIDRPEALETVADQLVVIGRARTFEGSVQVVVRVDGSDEPMVIDAVTGRGDGIFGDFDETFDLPAATANGGAALFIARSAEDGSVWQAGVIRILFGH